MQGERGMMDTMRPLAKLMSMSCLGWQRNNRSSTSVAFKNTIISLNILQPMPGPTDM